MHRTLTRSQIVLTVEPANLENDHLYLNGHIDFFPREAIGPSNVREGRGRQLRLHVAGVREPVRTDLPVNKGTRTPRGIFRGRKWVRQFFAAHKIRAGDAIVIERIDEFEYAIRPARQQPRVAEFFAGIGLVRLALETQGFKVVFANDIDPDKFAMYRANFPADDFLLRDVHGIGPDEVPDADLYTASFPCNDLSIAGAMAGLNGAQSGSFWALIRILEAKSMGSRPRVVLLENVPGFLMSHRGKDFESALLALNRLGYACDALIIDAVRFVPQSRARLFVIAQLGARPQPPFGLHPSTVRSPPLVDFIHAHSNVLWSVQQTPDLPTRGPRLPSIIEDLPADDVSWWDAARTDYFMNQLSPRHAKIAAEMIARRKYTYATAFRRVRYGRSMAELRTDGVAGCLRTPRGGSGRQILFKAGRGKRCVRLLTARECARLQGVPESYRIDVPLNKALFGFGDAVCVPVVEWIAANYVRGLLETLSVGGVDIDRVSGHHVS